MPSSECGKCKDCKWFQVEPGAKAGDLTMGLCIEQELQRYRLRVSGNSGCNCFLPGGVSHAAGSSAAPPLAAPTR